MTPKQFLRIIERNKLRRVDAAWIAGTSTRNIRALLSGQIPIGQNTELLFLAYDQKRIDDDWLVKHIRVPVPGSTSDYN